MSVVWVSDIKVVLAVVISIMENAASLKFCIHCIRLFVAGDAASTSLYALHSSLLREAPETNNLIHRHEYHSRLEGFNSQNNDGFAFITRLSCSRQISFISWCEIWEGIWATVRIGIGCFVWGLAWPIRSIAAQWATIHGRIGRKELHGWIIKNIDLWANRKSLELRRLK